MGDSGETAFVHHPSPITPRSRSRAPVLALLAANGVSLIGNQLTNLAIPWFVYTTTGSAAQTGLVAFFSILPTIIAMAFGGALADRIGHKQTSIASDLLSGATVAAVPLLYHTLGLPFPALLILVFLGALLDAPGGAARQALVPDAATMAQMPLERVNGTFQVIRSLSDLIGPPLAGLLIVMLGESNVLWVDAATFAFSAATVALLVPAGKAAPAAKQRYLADVAEGFRFLLKDRLLRTIAGLATMINFLLTPLVLVIMPVLANETYGNANALGIALGGIGAGSVLGALAFTAVGHRLPKRGTLIGAFALATPPLGLLALTPPLWITTAALALTGFWLAPINPLVGTVMQERVPAELRARVFGAVVATASLASPLGALIGGGLVAGVGVTAVVAAITGGLLLLAVIMVLSPALYDLRGTVKGQTTGG